MRTLQLAGSFLAFAVAFAAYGCALDVSGLEPTASTGGAGPTSASVGPGGGEVPITTSTGVSCTPSPEVCNDGLDNDCDNRVDCEDDNCTGALGYACSPAAPDGWTVVAFKPDPAAPCPKGYENPAKVTTKPTPTGGLCKCNCGAPPATVCTKGVLKVQFGHVSCMGDKFAFDATGGCDAIGKFIGQDPGDDWDDADATGPAVANAACTATPSAPPPLEAIEGISCAPASTGGKGCGSDSACLPRVDAAAWCIQKAGDVSCPGTAFPQRKV